MSCNKLQQLGIELGIVLCIIFALVIMLAMSLTHAKKEAQQRLELRHQTEGFKIVSGPDVVGNAHIFVIKYGSEKQKYIYTEVNGNGFSLIKLEESSKKDE